MSASIQHSSRTNEHPTPEAVVRAVWRTFRGAPDLDPASRRDHNEGVQALATFTAPSEQQMLAGSLGGLGREWSGKVFENPPGGSLTVRTKPTDSQRADSPGVALYKQAVREKYQTGSHAVAWWRHGLNEVLEGRVEQLIFVAFSIEIFQASQSKAWISPLRFPFCIPSKRLRFGGDQPTHANAIVYVGPPEGEARFCECFAKLGECRP